MLKRITGAASVLCKEQLKRRRARDRPTCQRDLALARFMAIASACLCSSSPPSLFFHDCKDGQGFHDHSLEIYLEKFGAFDMEKQAPRSPNGHGVFTGSVNQTYICRKQRQDHLRGLRKHARTRPTTTRG